MNATTQAARTVIIADMREGMHIRFNDPSDITTVVDGMVFGTPKIGHNGQCATRVFRVFGVTRTFVIEAHYSMTIYSPINAPKK